MTEPGRGSPEPREVELKLRVDPAHLERLSRNARLRQLTRGRSSTQTLHSVYFDTQDLQLLRAGISLRIRRVGRQWIQTLKLQEGRTAGLSSRRELELPVDGPHPSLDVLADPARTRRMGRAARRRIENVFSWRDAAAGLVQVFEETLRAAHRRPRAA